MRKFLYVALIIVVAAYICMVVYWPRPPIANIEGTIHGENSSCADKASHTPCIMVDTTSDGRSLHISWNAKNTQAGSRLELALGGKSHETIKYDTLAPKGEISWQIPATQTAYKHMLLDAGGTDPYQAPFAAGMYFVQATLYPSNYYQTGFSNPFCPEGKSCSSIDWARTTEFPIKHPFF